MLYRRKLNVWSSSITLFELTEKAKLKVVTSSVDYRTFYSLDYVIKVIVYSRKVYDH